MKGPIAQLGDIARPILLLCIVVAALGVITYLFLGFVNWLGGG